MPLINGLGQDVHFSWFPCGGFSLGLAVTAALSQDEELLYLFGIGVNSALRESVQHRHSLKQLNERLQTVLVETYT